MSGQAKVYLDTNVYKFSATAVPIFRLQEMKTYNWGGQTISLPVYDPVIENPNDRIHNPDLKEEADLLPEVATLASEGRATFMASMETRLEGMFLPNMSSQTGFFYGAQVVTVAEPIKYGRVAFGGNEHPSQAQFAFLRSLTEKRFIELQVIVGAYQGEDKPPNRNQLLDAFHLWCAEYHECDYFLSLDFKLARVVSNAKKKPKVRIVRPSELLAATK
jgi:hypothetical protein